MSKSKTTRTAKPRHPAQPRLVPGLQVNVFTLFGDGPHVARIVGTVPGYAVVQVEDEASSYDGEVHAVTIDRIGVVPAAA